MTIGAARVNALANERATRRAAARWPELKAGWPQQTWRPGKTTSYPARRSRVSASATASGNARSPRQVPNSCTAGMRETLSSQARAGVGNRPGGSATSFRPRLCRWTGGRSRSSAGGRMASPRTSRTPSFARQAARSSCSSRRSTGSARPGHPRSPRPPGPRPAATPPKRPTARPAPAGKRPRAGVASSGLRSRSPCSVRSSSPRSRSARSWPPRASRETAPRRAQASVRRFSPRCISPSPAVPASSTASDGGWTASTSPAGRTPTSAASSSTGRSSPTARTGSRRP